MKAWRNTAQNTKQLSNDLLKTITSFTKGNFAQPSTVILFLKRKMPVNLCYLITNLRPSRLPLWHRHSLSVLYVSSPWLPGAPRPPWANTNLLLCGFPFSPVLIHITEAAADAEDLFFSHLCCHVKPRFIHLLNPNVIFTMLVCKSWGNEAWLFFDAVRVMSAQLG